jgi:hypothetical protein
LTPAAARCRRKFLRFFPLGFRDETYIDWERDYKWLAHERWLEHLDRDAFRASLAREEFAEIAQRAVSIESRTKPPVLVRENGAPRRCEIARWRAGIRDGAV